MSELSPAAQAVLDAALQYEINPECYSREIAAAALRAAALHAHSEEYVTCGGASYALMIEVDDLLSIASELERSGQTSEFRRFPQTHCHD